MATIKQLEFFIFLSYPIELAPDYDQGISALAGQEPFEAIDSEYGRELVFRFNDISEIGAAFGALNGSELWFDHLEMSIARVEVDDSPTEQA